MVNIRYAIGLNSFQKYIPTTVAEDVSDETVAAIMEHLPELQGVDIAGESMRRYTDSKYFANLIGVHGTDLPGGVQCPEQGGPEEVRSDGHRRKVRP